MFSYFMQCSHTGSTEGYYIIFIKRTSNEAITISMYRFLFCFLLTGLISSGAKAQSVKGILQDVSDNTPVSECNC